jgi:hypothetical protein
MSFLHHDQNHPHPQLVQSVSLRSGDWGCMGRRWRLGLSLHEWQTSKDDVGPSGKR